MASYSYITSYNQDMNTYQDNEGELYTDRIHINNPNVLLSSPIISIKKEIVDNFSITTSNVPELWINNSISESFFVNQICEIESVMSNGIIVTNMVNPEPLEPFLEEFNENQTLALKLETFLDIPWDEPEMHPDSDQKKCEGHTVVFKKNTPVRHSNKHRPIILGGKKSYSCNQCPVACTTSSSLKRHKMIHSNIMAFKCELCEYKCKESMQLKTHHRTHTGEKPYECKICHNKYARSFSLKNHIRSHTGEKPFECQLCNKKFARSLSLKIHMIVHTGEKPFKCSICPMTFSNHNNMKRHEKNHSGIKPYACDRCEFRCAAKESLKAHIQRHMGIKIPKAKIKDTNATTTDNN